MQVIENIDPLRARLAAEPGIAFVPTMGNLHAGHLKLAEVARQRAGCVVASIFVNRLQFEPGADFDRYPRTFDDDCAKLESAGVDVVFAPDERELYPEPQEVLVQPPGIAQVLEGEHRPGHFAGMATVVLKLFNIVRPHIAVFGKKDYQQLAIVRAMAKQLNVPTTIEGVDTVRAADGLALSSRNGYLSAAERDEAPRLYWNLLQIERAIQSGRRDYDMLEKQAVEDLTSRGWRVDYLAPRQRTNLAKPARSDSRLVVLAAAWLGKTRLIDNLEVDAG